MLIDVYGYRTAGAPGVCIMGRKREILQRVVVEVS